MIHIPKDRLQEDRLRAFEKYKRTRRRRKQMQSLVVAALFCIGLLVSIQVSPTFASYAAKVPGLKVIVELMQENEGIKDVINNDYYEEVGQMIQHDDVTITLQGVIVDEYNIMAMYSFDYMNATTEHMDYSIDIYQGDQLLEASYTYGNNESIEDAQTHSEHKLDMKLDTPLQLDEPNFRIVFTMNDTGTIFSFPITLTKPVAAAKVLEPNIVINAQGQQLIITKILRTPISLQVTVQPDASNKMRILALNDVVAVLNNGTKREQIINGFVGKGSLHEGEYTLYMQSNYFEDADTMTLTIGEIHAVMKGEDFIEVDFATGELVSKPSWMDWPITIEDQNVTYVAPIKNNHIRQNFYPAYKADGSILDSTGSSASTDEQFATVVDMYESYEGVAKILVNYVEHPIAKNTSVTIPLH